MNARIVILALLAAGATACSQDVLQSTTKASVLVEDRSDQTKRFWVTLVDQKTNERFSRVNVAKHCRKGPARLAPGRIVTASIEMRRNSKTGVVTRRVNSDDLKKRFC